MSIFQPDVKQQAAIIVSMGAQPVDHDPLALLSIIDQEKS